MANFSRNDIARYLFVVRTALFKLGFLLSCLFKRNNQFSLVVDCQALFECVVLLKIAIKGLIRFPRPSILDTKE